jgi:hypothetical protein
MTFGGVAARGDIFSKEECARIMAYWNKPGRYRVCPPPEAARYGPWQVRLTPEGSLWLHKYQTAIGKAKTPPTQTARGNSAWEAWIEKKLNYDRWQALLTAEAANEALFALANSTRGDLPNRARRRRQLQPVGEPIPQNPPPPGPIPDSLEKALGNPPVFAAAVTPMRHIVTFDDGDDYAFNDNVVTRPRYAYYRFPQGVAHSGQSLGQISAAELDALFSSAGLSASEQKIARAVSPLEGGFDSINTYDTGFVSVGFLQFITASDGRASLCAVLHREKMENPAAFRKDFRRFGIDLNQDKTLVVVDPTTGAELVGPEAVQKLIEDKRLIAVFQRAGRRSPAFRIAQIKIAKARYWPADDPIKITLKDGTILTCRAGELIRSEAGMATLFDRKVNRGNIGPLAEVAARVMNDRNLKTLDEARLYEREIVAGMKWRVDFLTYDWLSQPPPVPQPPPTALPETVPAPVSAGSETTAPQANQTAPSTAPESVAEPEGQRVAPE